MSIYKITKDSNLSEIGVKPGWFCRHGDCSIWFEIISVYDKSLTCVSRNPKNVKEYIMVSNSFSSLYEVSEKMPVYGKWIKADREKNFFDKFYPEKLQN